MGKLFNNLKIANKMLLVMMLGAVFMIIVGGTGYYYLNKTSNLLEYMYNEAFVPLYMLVENEVNNEEIHKHSSNEGEAEKKLLHHIEHAEKIHHENQMYASTAKSILLTVIIIGIVIALFFAWYLGRIIEKPIKQIVKVTNDIADGDLTTKRLTISSKDEIGQLAHSVNQMSKNLKGLIDQTKSASGTVSSYSDNLSRSLELATHSTNQVAATLQDVADHTNVQKV